MNRNFWLAVVLGGNLIIPEPASAGDSSNGLSNPSVSLTTATIGQTCNYSGLSAFSTNGSLLSCQGGRWSQPAAFRTYDVTISDVNAKCSGGDDFTLIQYNLTCASRYCIAVKGVKFGHITEYGAGFNSDRPYRSSPNTVIGLSCAR